MSKPYRQLARRIVISALAVSLIPLYILGAAIYMHFSSVQQEQSIAELRNLALNRVNAIVLFLDERTSLLEVLAQTASLKDLVTPGALDRVFRLLNNRSRTFLDLGVIDQNGSHLAYVGPHTLGDRNYKDAPWFHETMLRGVYVSDVFLGFRGTPHFVVAVRHGHGPDSWILRATIDSQVFTNLVRSAQLGKHGDAYIVNGQGQFQTRPRFDGKVLSASGMDVNAVPRGTTVQERTLPDGRKRLTAFSWLPNKNWLLVIDEDPSEVSEPLKMARNAEFAILGLGSLLIVVSVFLWVRLIVRKLAEQDRERHALDARLAHSARLVSLGRMAAGVAHEINNPLAAIGELAGLVEDLLDDEYLKENPHGALFKENMIKIAEHVERARSVTHRLLGFARRMEPRLEDIQINNLLEEAFSFLEKEASLRNVRVDRHLAEDLPQIKSDRAQLQQVVLNLLSNAMDAVGDDGQGEIAMTTRQTDDSVEVIISDNGSGIPQDLQDKIFDPFFTTKSPGEGTGLGLSISYSIMENLGGRLTFQSRPGQGATFTITIPKALA